MALPLSLLDRSAARAGHSDAAALHSTVERARHAETAGYHRFWVSEHHGVPGVVSGRPALMAQAVAAATRSIRVGSGGVMLPNHRPIVVAEEFATLVALHGERFDLGLGRSLGFTAAVREALGAFEADPARFVADVEAVVAYLSGATAVTMRPAGAGAVPVFILGTGSGLAAAARLGLLAVVGGPLLQAPREAFDEYRRTFRPGGQRHEPYLIVSTEIYVADSRPAALELARPQAWAMTQSRTTGTFSPLAPTTAIPANPPSRQQERMEATLRSAIVGSEREVAAELSALVEHTGADEVMNTATTYDVEALHECDRRLAAVARELTPVTG